MLGFASSPLPAKPTKILNIALITLAMPADRERCLEARTDDYMSKPAGLKEVYQRLLHHL